jgi:hypothetical protein
MSGNLNAWQRWKKDLGTTRPWDLWNPNVVRATDEEAERRFEICSSCPLLVDLTKQCSRCGCFMALKVKIGEATCPENMW